MIGSIGDTKMKYTSPSCTGGFVDRLLKYLGGFGTQSAYSLTGRGDVDFTDNCRSYDDELSSFKYRRVWANVRVSWALRGKRKNLRIDIVLEPDNTMTIRIIRVISWDHSIVIVTKNIKDNSLVIEECVKEVSGVMSKNKNEISKEYVNYGLEKALPSSNLARSSYSRILF